jgi:hypothetical protein
MGSNMKNWISHAVLCFLIALFRWDYAILIGVTIELVQAEHGFKHPLTKEFWRRLLSKDTIIDLVADGIGIGIALLIRHFFT